MRAWRLRRSIAGVFLFSGFSPSRFSFTRIAHVVPVLSLADHSTSETMVDPSPIQQSSFTEAIGSIEHSMEPVFEGTKLDSHKGHRFWLVFLSICSALFLSALELTAVSTVLPTIAHALHTTEFVWVGSAYALASTAFLPMSGNVAQLFGRRPALLSCLGLFAAGSAICGAAQNMPMLVAGRTVQGLGGGGIQSLSAIILADMVTLQERGAYAGLFGLYVFCPDTALA